MKSGADSCRLCSDPRGRSVVVIFLDCEFSGNIARLGAGTHFRVATPLGGANYIIFAKLSC